MFNFKYVLPHQPAVLYTLDENIVANPTATVPPSIPMTSKPVPHPTSGACSVPADMSSLGLQVTGYPAVQEVKRRLRLIKRCHVASLEDLEE